jgi:hypothetical protein|tara:strand:+ start:84 stop:236 length:153 start_codon:yes stop_codon:yes gene_type:complete
MGKTTKDYLFDFLQENPDKEFKLKTIGHEVRERAVKETGDEEERVSWKTE